MHKQSSSRFPNPLYLTRVCVQNSLFLLLKLFFPSLSPCYCGTETRANLESANEFTLYSMRLMSAVWKVWIVGTGVVCGEIMRLQTGVHSLESNNLQWKELLRHPYSLLLQFVRLLKEDFGGVGFFRCAVYRCRFDMFKWFIIIGCYEKLKGSFVRY